MSTLLQFYTNAGYDLTTVQETATAVYSAMNITFGLGYNYFTLGQAISIIGTDFSHVSTLTHASLYLNADSTSMYGPHHFNNLLLAQKVGDGVVQQEGIMSCLQEAATEAFRIQAAGYSTPPPR